MNATINEYRVKYLLIFHLFCTMISISTIHIYLNERIQYFAKVK